MHPWRLIAPQTQLKSLFYVIDWRHRFFCSLSARCKTFVRSTAGTTHWTSAERWKSRLQEKWVEALLNHSAGSFVHMLMQSCEFYKNCITRADPNRELLFTFHLASYFLAGTDLMASVRMKKWQNAFTMQAPMPSRLPAQSSAIFGVLTCLAQVNFMVFNDYIFNDCLRLCAGL